MRKILTFLCAALMSVGMFAETVTWNSSDLPNDGDENPFTHGGVTLTAGDMIHWDIRKISGGGTFTTELGNFTKIEITASNFDIDGDGWAAEMFNNNKWTWTGNAASVSFGGSQITGLSSIVFTIGGAAPAAPAWVRDGDDWDEASKTLTVNSDLPVNAYMNQTDIEHVIISSGVTSIGNAAFLWCEALASIEIPDGVTSIGESAFAGCSALTSILIPYGVTSIGNGAFASSGLTSITIPSSVTSIGNEVFQSCSSLTSITIPNNLTSIGAYAFESCSSLTSVTIPNSVTSIGEGAFYGSGLTSVTIPNSVTSIGTAVFAFCGSLSSIEIPSSVTSIGWHAFWSCTGLTSITIPSSVTSIGADAFRSCTNITDVYCYPNAADLTWEEDGCNDFKDNKATACHVYAGQLSAYQTKFNGTVNVTFVAIPAPEPANPSGSCGDNLSWEFDSSSGTLTITGTGDMYDYDDEGNTAPWASSIEPIESFTSVIISDGVTSIGDWAFVYCSGLTSVTIPNSVTSIGMAAFGMCGLTSIEIPGSVTSIGVYAFAYCLNLETVTNYATTPQNIESKGVFESVTLSGCTLYVPEGSIGLYQAAEVWQDFGTKSAIPPP